MIYDQLLQKDTKLAVIGLGYVGLPIALEFAKRIIVIGFDINASRVGMMQRGEDPSRNSALLISKTATSNLPATSTTSKRPRFLLLRCLRL